MRLSAIMLLTCYHLIAANAKLFPIHDGEHCGFSDASGKVLIPPQFTDCADFSEGLAPVQIDERWGYIDEPGTLIIPPTFLVADQFSEGLAFVTTADGSKAVIDRHGKVLFSANYYQHGKFSEGFAAVNKVDKWICRDGNSEPRDGCAGRRWLSQGPPMGLHRYLRRHGDSAPILRRWGIS